MRKDYNMYFEFKVISRKEDLELIRLYILNTIYNDKDYLISYFKNSQSRLENKTL